MDVLGTGGIKKCVFNDTINSLQLVLTTLLNKSAYLISTQIPLFQHDSRSSSETLTMSSLLKNECSSTLNTSSRTCFSAFPFFFFPSLSSSSPSLPLSSSSSSSSSDSSSVSSPDSSSSSSSSSPSSSPSESSSPDAAGPL